MRHEILFEGTIGRTDYGGRIQGLHLEETRVIHGRGKKMKDKNFVSLITILVFQWKVLLGRREAENYSLVS